MRRARVTKEVIELRRKLKQGAKNRWYTERLEIVKTLDIKRARKFFRKFGMYEPKEDLAVLAGLHKARLYLNEISENEKEKSREWLKEYGLSERIY